MANLLNFL
jgi:putative restriction endonuclease